jgi:MFS family permease
VAPAARAEFFGFMDSPVVRRSFERARPRGFLERGLSLARNARFAVSGVFFVFGMLFGSWLPHIPDVQRQLGINYAVLGRALLCSGFGAVSIMPALGYLVHRFGSRPLMVFSGIGACLLVPLLPTHTSLFGLCFNLFVLGTCYGTLDVAMNSHAMHVQALHERPILSAIHGWFSLGGILGGLGAAVAYNVGLTPLAHLITVSGLLIGVMLVSNLYLLPASVDRDSEGPKLVIPHGILLVLGLLTVCAFMAEGGILDWCALYVRQSLLAKPEVGGIATATCSGAMAVGRFVGDPLLHRFGNRNMVVTGGFATLFGLVAAVSVHEVSVCIVCLSVASFGLANMVPVFFKQAAKVPGVPSGTAMAAVSTCGYAGFLLGPPAIGAIARGVSLTFSFGALGVLGLVVAVVSWFVLDSGS